MENWEGDEEERRGSNLKSIISRSLARLAGAVMIGLTHICSPYVPLQERPRWRRKFSIYLPAPASKHLGLIHDTSRNRCRSPYCVLGKLDDSEKKSTYNGEEKSPEKRGRRSTRSSSQESTTSVFRRRQPTPTDRFRRRRHETGVGLILDVMDASQIVAKDPASCVCSRQERANPVGSDGETTENSAGRKEGLDSQ